MATPETIEPNEPAKGDDAFPAAFGNYVIDLDKIPLPDHALLREMGRKINSKYTMRQYTKFCRCLLAAIDTRAPGYLQAEPLKPRLTTTTLGWMSDYICELSDPQNAIEYVKGLRKTRNYLWPDVPNSIFENEIVRLLALPQAVCEETNSNRYRLPRERIPKHFNFIFETIDASTNKKTNKPLRDRDGMAGFVCRFFGALSEAGVNCDELTEKTLCSVDNLRIYGARLDCESDDADTVKLQKAKSLQQVRRALKAVLVRAPEAVTAFKTILAEYGVESDEPQAATSFIPSGDLERLTASFDRPAHERKAGELGAPKMKKRMVQTFERFHRVLKESGDPRFNRPDYDSLDLDAAVFIYEKSRLHVEDSTLITELTDLQAVYDRVYFGKPGLSTKGLRFRLKQLGGAAPNEVIVPENVTPDDFRELGVRYMVEAWQYIEGFLNADGQLDSTMHPYRDVRELAVKYRNGVIFTLWSFISLRVSNMACLLRDDYIKKVGKRWQISIPGWILDENGKKLQLTKNGENIHQKLEEWVTPYLDRYDKIIRPLICDIVEGINDLYFFVSLQGGAVSISEFGNIVTTITKKEFGIRIPCHVIRKIDASHAREAAPDEVDAPSIVNRQKDKNRARKNYETRLARARAVNKLRALQDHDRFLVRLA